MQKLRATALLLTCAALLPRGASATEKWVILHNFGGEYAVQPESTVVEITPNVFVGSYAGGLFQVTPSGSFSVFSSFNNSTFSVAGSGALTPASNGYFYGVASNGESSSAVYRISSSGERTIINESLTLASPLIEGLDGNLWGTQGSATTGYSAFKMSLEGSLTTVAAGLSGPTDGPLVQASDGNFYGATTATSPSGSGQIYRVTPAGQIDVLYTFQAGEGSFGGLTQATNGLLYGTSLHEDDACPTPAGGVFAISLSGSFTSLRTIGVCETSGPLAGLLEASNGLLYGSTSGAGNYNDGSVFSIGLNGEGFQTVVSFDLSDGSSPNTEGPALTQGSDGDLYGTTDSGGSGTFGTVYQLDYSLPPPLPGLRAAQPTAGAPGATVLLVGNYLLNLTGVSFNGTPATFTPINVNYARAVVPAGATTGPITVTTMNGSFTTKNNFTVE